MWVWEADHRDGENFASSEEKKRTENLVMESGKFTDFCCCWFGVMWKHLQRIFLQANWKGFFFIIAMEMPICSDGADFAAVMPILQRRRTTPTRRRLLPSTHMPPTATAMITPTLHHQCATDWWSNGTLNGAVIKKNLLRWYPPTELRRVKKIADRCSYTDALTDNYTTIWRNTFNGHWE